MQPVGLHHVSIDVTDVPAARSSDVDVLGLAERSERPDLGCAGAWLDAGGQQVHLIEGAPPPAVGQHLARHPEPVGTGRQAFLTDPSGNGVELDQP